jgi:hypothetical protein
MAAAIYTAIYVAALAGIAVGFWAATAFISKYRGEDKAGADTGTSESDGQPLRKKRLFGRTPRSQNANLDDRLNSRERSVSMAEFESDMSGISESEIIERRQKNEDKQYAVLKNIVRANAKENPVQAGQPDAENAGTA